ncbi:hypothetical protein [Perlucidibaca aquatica]|nr:hypothetical protein [Perlucidibaca aquatica]
MRRPRCCSLIIHITTTVYDRQHQHASVLYPVQDAIALDNNLTDAVALAIKRWI